MISYLLAYLYNLIMASENSRHPRRLVIGTRDSVLAIAQTEIVERFLREHFPEVEIERVALKVAGDKDIKTALRDMQERKSLWTEELEELLVQNKLDIIVHSLKDMPTKLPENCALGAITEREDPRDALVVRADLNYTSLASLPASAVVGTSSVRRMAQISRMHPSYQLRDMRGNIHTRLRKLDDVNNGYDALILAAAGLHRVGFQGRVTEYLSSPTMLHAVGQGAVGVEIRKGDAAIMKLLEKLNHVPTALACLAERELLRTLEGGCSVPIGVETRWEEGVLEMKAVVSNVQGTKWVETEERREVATPEEAEEFGHFIADHLIAIGATPILEEVEKEKKEREAAKRAQEQQPVGGEPVIV